MAPPKKTLYQILGVERDANDVDIDLAHQRRVAEMRRAVPPDPSAEALVQQAFEVLSNANRRAAYDAQLLTAAERSAAAEQQTTDLEIGEEEEAKSKLPLAMLATGAFVAILGAFFALKPGPAPKPAQEPVAAAPQPATPPPPRVRTAGEVLGSVAATTGRVMGYSMSGTATPIGLAVGIEPGTMVTTCHGISAGGSLVVRVGKEQFPADLTITDEALNLCRLSLPGYGTPPVKIAAEPPKAGDKVYTLGLDSKSELAMAEGTVTGIRGSLIEVSTPIAATGTGAGVFDQYGALVGIATTRHDLAHNVHIAIPATAIAQMRSRTK